MPDSLSQLQKLLDHCMARDRHGLRRKLSNAEKDPSAEKLSTITAQLEKSVAQAELRQQNMPGISYPDLPVTARRDEIVDAIRNNQVIIICGETGSGKTTQLPKLCLEAGRGKYGLIGHTQPRRIAARSVANRIAEELQCQIGTHVGFKVRFSDHTTPSAYIKLMTDGILLAELQQDRFLNQYDTLIIDEAHERSLNIDFLLGYLQSLVKKRPDLKLIITSATIDPDSFSRHFNHAPVINVSGRTYPVEVRYRPLVDRDDEAERDLTQAILDACDELGREGNGDILVFLSGEREIRETAEALRKHHPPHTEILPLFSRLSVQEQNRIFAPHATRRIVLATNVAETSLTVPGIRYVIDSGYARISRYSFRSKVQRLPVEKISQASANQRMGRCGRVAEGICIRLYSEEDFNRRSEFTDAEVLRTNLASVILQLENLRLGHIENFPFIDRPDKRLLKDGFRLLEELQAIEGHKVTKLGKQLARLPVDPRIGRMLISAEQLGALDETAIIASALSIQDPRERPMDKQQQADTAHQQWRDEESDFISYLNLWRYYHEQRHHLSRNKLIKLCQKQYISWRRMEEWRDIHSQLLQQCMEMKFHHNQQAADYERIHQALLTGLLTQVGIKTEESDYEGVRNSRFHIFPGSGLFKKKPRWIMCASLVETTRLYAHDVAAIKPEWVEQYADHIIRRSYSEPHWQKRAAQVAAMEKKTLYGLVINPGKRVNYGPIDPDTSREIFLRNALVLMEYNSHAPFMQHNRQIISEIEELEHKSRRLDVLIDEQTVFDFFDSRVPSGIYNGHTFEKWRKQAEKEQPKLLFLNKENLMRHEAEKVTSNRYPDHISINGLDLKLDYHFEPGHPLDGVTLTIPLALLPHLDPVEFEWLVPGLLKEKITALIRNLPKSLRRNFVPAPDHAEMCLSAMNKQGALLPALSQQLKKLTGIDVAVSQWQLDILPLHLQMNFRLVDEHNVSLDVSRDLAALQQKWQRQAQQNFSTKTDWEIERSNIRQWDFPDLPEHVSNRLHDLDINGYPALHDNGDSVSIRVYASRFEAQQVHRTGIKRLLRNHLSQQVKYLKKNLPGIDKLCLHYAPLGKCDDLKEDLINSVLEQGFLQQHADIRSQADFLAIIEQGRGEMINIANQICAQLSQALSTYTVIRKKLKGRVQPGWIESLNDVEEQLEHLFYEGFISDTPVQWLQHYPRYLQAIEKRLDKLQQNADRDRQHTRQLQPLWQNYIEQQDHYYENESLQTYRWLLEELRVSFFAQELKTSQPVSVKRLDTMWREISREL